MPVTFVTNVLGNCQKFSVLTDHKFHFEQVVRCKKPVATLRTLGGHITDIELVELSL